jgi:hypothetical protein
MPYLDNKPEMYNRISSDMFSWEDWMDTNCLVISTQQYMEGAINTDVNMRMK